MGEEIICGGCFLGSQWCCQILIFSPLPTHHRAPCCRTSLPLWMLLHAYNLNLELAASIIEEFGKNLALKILYCAIIAKFALLGVNH